MRKTQNVRILFGPALLLTGCHASPSLDILGSYFPSWLLCAVIGIVLTIAIYIILLKTGIDEFLPARLLIYPCLVLMLTLFTWLIWFGN